MVGECALFVVVTPGIAVRVVDLGEVALGIVGVGQLTIGGRNPLNAVVAVVTEGEGAAEGAGDGGQTALAVVAVLSDQAACFGAAGKLALGVIVFNVESVETLQPITVPFGLQTQAAVRVTLPHSIHQLPGLGARQP